ncbi:hypothetical protein C0J45_16061 [Silurus meridionalis]|nr:hypothetical protein C0J45_16061 [Silurus meridionalis]
MGGPLPPAMGGPLPTHFSPFCNPVVITRFVRFTVVCQFAYNRRNLSFPGKQVPATGVVPSVSDQRFSLRSFKYSSEGIRTATDGWTILSNGGRTTSSAGSNTLPKAGGPLLLPVGGPLLPPVGGPLLPPVGGPLLPPTYPVLAPHLLTQDGSVIIWMGGPFPPPMGGPLPLPMPPTNSHYQLMIPPGFKCSSECIQTSSANAASDLPLPTHDSSLVRLLFRRHMDFGQWADHFLRRWADHFFCRWPDHFLRRFKYSSEGIRTATDGRTTSSAGGRTTSSAGGRTTSFAGGRTTSSTDISGPRTSSPHTGRFCNYMDGRTTSSADGRTTSSADAAYEQLLPTYDSSLVRLLFRRHMDSGRWAGHFLGQWEDHFLGRWVDHFLGRRRLFYRPTFPLCPYGPVPPRPFCKVF